MYMLLGTSLAKVATDWGRKAPSATFCTGNSPVGRHGSIPWLHMPSHLTTLVAASRPSSRSLLARLEEAVSAFMQGHRIAAGHGDHILTRHQRLHVAPDNSTPSGTACAAHPM